MQNLIRLWIGRTLIKARQITGGEDKYVEQLQVDTFCLIEGFDLFVALNVQTERDLSS